MRYLDLAEAFVLAEAVTGIDAHDLVRVSRVELLDSALHAPAAGHGTVDLYPTLTEKAAVLCVRIASNHPLPDGNKRLAWMSMVVFLELNDVTLQVQDDEAVQTMLAVAAGRCDHTSLSEWLSQHIKTESQ